MIVRHLLMCSNLTDEFGVNEQYKQNAYIATSANKNDLAVIQCTASNANTNEYTITQITFSN